MLDRSDLYIKVFAALDAGWGGTPPLAYPNVDFDRETDSASEQYMRLNYEVVQGATIELGSAARARYDGRLVVLAGGKTGIGQDQLYANMDLMAAIFPRGTNVTLDDATIARFLNPIEIEPVRDDPWFYVGTVFPFFIDA